jgi:hypothetical protein
MSIQPATTQQQFEMSRTSIDTINTDSADAKRPDYRRAVDHRPRFEHRELPYPESVRLVKIRSIHPEIECEIRTARLSNFPSFEALSYCWGPAGVNVPIVTHVCSMSLLRCEMGSNNYTSIKSLARQNGYGSTRFALTKRTESSEHNKYAS